MTKAKAFQSIGSAAIKVLARLEARKAAKEQFRAQGIRTYRHVELLRQASEYGPVWSYLSFTMEAGT